MIRVVVSVMLAVALVAAAQPAVEQAAGERTDAEVRAAVDELDVAATELARSEEAAAGAGCARRVVTLALPAAGPATAPVERLVVEPTGSAYHYRVGGRANRTVAGSVPVYTLDGEPLVLEEAGRHRLVLTLVEVGGTRRVVVERLQSGAGELSGADELSGAGSHVGAGDSSGTASHSGAGDRSGAGGRSDTGHAPAERER